MHTKKIIKQTLIKSGTEIIAATIPLVSRSKYLRNTVLYCGEKYINTFSVETNSHIVPRPIGVDEDRQEFSKVIRGTADRILAYKLSKPFLRNVSRNLVDGIMIKGASQTPILKFNETYGTNPPGFLTISPGKACNLRCTGCYANAGADAEKLDWNIFNRIITEAETLWGVRFIVISGGEPLAYQSEGKDILDAIEAHPNVFFLMYTNGTLMNNDIVGRMAKLGNITPAISVEGWRESTDKRRGLGIFDQVLSSMSRLKNAGVPFGISLTATRNNVEEIFSDEFIDYFFEEQGALYGWLFHYMPIGRSFTLDLMPTPEQRVWMWKRIWEIIHTRHIFLADFWNHGTLSDGCLAGGRSDGGGYMYVDWNGAVTPCVFVPYSPVNIKEVFNEGGSMNNVWQDTFFSRIREWQDKYRRENGNWLSPCIIRDHYQELRTIVTKEEPEPIDENASKALLDPEYEKGLKDYDEKYEQLVDPLWEEYYLHPKIRSEKHNRPNP